MANKYTESCSLLLMITVLMQTEKWSIITHLSEWLTEMLTNVKKFIHSNTAGENAMIQPNWKTVWQVSYKSKQVPYSPVTAPFGHLARRNENYVWTKLYMKIYSIFIHNSWKLETVPAVLQQVNG